MQIITLLSDWGTRDPYLASVKGQLALRLPEAQIIDISHDITPFDITQASFVLRQAFPNFPEGTIHLIGINTEASIETPHTLIKYCGHYFIGADNGIFNLLMSGEEAQQIIELDLMQDSEFFTFSTKDLFIKAAVFLATGTAAEALGTVKTTINTRYSFLPVKDGNVLKGKVIYIDNYENLITNITAQQFESFGKGNPFQVLFRSSQYRIKRLSTSYSDVSEGEMVALFGTHGFLEIAINRGTAASLLGMSVDDMIRIEFQFPQ
ncbi:MAG: hypothetical protein EOL88_05800 [Bacteroidia bacterium]|nr:hypothetical protein [Bacteroidia bacterium]